MERPLLLSVARLILAGNQRPPKKVRKMKSYNRFAILLAALSIIAAMHTRLATQTASAQATIAKSSLAREATPELRRETFEIVWRTIKEKHFDPKLNGVDWDKVHAIYAPRVNRVKNDDEFYKLLQDMLNERFLGAAGSTLRLVYLDANEHRHGLKIKREVLKGEMSPPVGDFPSFLTEFESKRLADGIGYIRFNFFHPVLNQRIREAVRSMSDAPGIIIDLRGNPGGFDGVGQGLAGLLLDKKTSLGISHSREGFENYIVYPQKNPYTGPVVILVDCMSGSASESFSGGMQSIGRAAVIGETSGGGDLDASVDKLPTGALLLYAYADFVTAKGVSLEGRGVTPDIEVKLH